MAASNLEGKTLGLPGLPCQNCGDIGVVTYCDECRLDLCHKCDRFHSKSSITKDHIVLPIAQKPTTSAKPKRNQPRCAIHNAKLNSICDTCHDAICNQCKPQHKGHKIIKSNLHVGVLQKICRKNIPGLVDLMQQLDQCRDLPSKVEVYKKARLLVEGWRTRIISVTNNEADLLLTELDAEIFKHVELLKEHGQKLQEHSDEIDKIMTHLNSMKRVSDADTLVTAIHSCNRTMDDIKSFVTEYEINNGVIDEYQLLPHSNHIDEIEQLLKSTFKMQESTSSQGTADDDDGDVEDIVADFDQLSEQMSTALPFKHGACYKISECNISGYDKVVIYDWREHDVYEVDIRTLEKTRYCCNKRISSMVTLAPDQHVIVEYDGERRRIHLLDGQFRVVKTMPKFLHGNFTPRAICVELDSDTFILQESLECSCIPKSRFQRIKISHNKFHCDVLRVQDIAIDTMLMSAGRGIFVIADGMFCDGMGLNVYESDYMDHCRINLDYDVHSVYVDNENKILVGGSHGKVRLLSPDGSKYKVLKTGKGEVDGIAVKGSCLVVSVGCQVKFFN